MAGGLLPGTRLSVQSPQECVDALDEHEKFFKFKLKKNQWTEGGDDGASAETENGDEEGSQE